MDNRAAQQLAAMLTAKQRADIVQLAQIITAPATVPPVGAAAPARGKRPRAQRGSREKYSGGCAIIGSPPGQSEQCGMPMP